MLNESFLLNLIFSHCAPFVNSNSNLYLHGNGKKFERTIYIVIAHMSVKLS